MSLEKPKTESTIKNLNEILEREMRKYGLPRDLLNAWSPVQFILDMKNPAGKERFINILTEIPSYEEHNKTRKDAEKETIIEKYTAPAKREAYNHLVNQYNKELAQIKETRNYERLAELYSEIQKLFPDHG